MGYTLESGAMQSMIPFAQVEIGSDAAIVCAQCTSAARGIARPFDVIVDDLDRALSEWDAPSTPGVRFTGFEPFDHPQLPAMIGEARSLGFDRIMLSTDGASLSHGDNAAGCLLAGVTHLEVSVLADSINDGPVHRAGGLETALAGIRAFMAHSGGDAFVSGRLPVCRHNIAEVASSVALMGAHGVSAVWIDVGDVDGGRKAHAYLDAILQTATVNRVHAWVTGWDAELPVVYRRSPFHFIEVT